MAEAAKSTLSWCPSLITILSWLTSSTHNNQPFFSNGERKLRSILASLLATALTLAHSLWVLMFVHLNVLGGGQVMLGLLVFCMMMIAYGQAVPVWVACSVLALLFFRMSSVEKIRQSIYAVGWLCWAAYKCAQRGLIVYRYLDVCKGLLMGLRMVLFVIVLLPGLLRVAWDYVVNPNVLHDVPYGTGPRQLLDVYLPAQHHSIAFPGKRPIVVMISGGAWMIGVKCWVFLPASILASMGFLVFSPDYPNFPEADAEAMVKSCALAVQWAMTSPIVRDQFQGDQTNVYVMGQSAGANIAATLVTRKAQHDLVLCEQGWPNSPDGDLESDVWEWGPSPIRGLISIAGLYNIKEEIEAFHSKGLSEAGLHGIFGADPTPFSPTLIVKQHGPTIAHFMPPVLLSCGSTDTTAPSKFTHAFAETLLGSGIPTEVLEVPNKSHTATIVEDPLDSSCTEDPFLSSAVAFMIKTLDPPLSAEAQTALQAHTFAPKWSALVPACAVRFARWINPL